MAGEGLDTGGVGDPGAGDPGRAAREAADRIAQQVRDILQTAEQRAADIRSRAQQDADEIRESAAGAAARMLERVDELEHQIDSFLREFFDTIRSELRGLAPLEDIDAAAAATHATSAAGELTERLGAEAEPETEAEPEAEARPFEEPAKEKEPEEAEEPRRRRGLLWGRREREPEPSEEPEGEQRGTEGAESPEDAHVMALNMALNGTPRDETESYLVQRFGSLDDLESILDDVYGRVKRG
jgi:hypothetical protein